MAQRIILKYSNVFKAQGLTLSEIKIFDFPSALKIHQTIKPFVPLC